MIRSFFVFSIVVGCHAGGFSQKSGELVGVSKTVKPLNVAKDCPKEWKMFFGDLVFIAGGSRTIGGGHYVDSTVSMQSRRVSISSFYISSTEVTNLQYRSFCKAVEKWHGKDSAVKLLPDTACWSRFYAYGEPMATYYFSHPAYHSYPVVGVNYSQAVAYTQWLTTQLHESPVLNQFVMKGTLGNVHLPTEAEWTFGAYGALLEDATRTPNFPWGNEFLLQSKDGSLKLMANGAGVKDSKGFEVISNMSDGGAFTTKVKSYPANVYGLYDMAGNVNEWLLDSYRFESVFNEDFDLIKPKPRVAETNGSQQMVVKGGGFMDQPYFLTISSRRGMPINTQQPDLGFRIAITIMGENNMLAR